MPTPTLHPFDAIAFDGDGRCTPGVELEVVDEQRATWQAMNAAVVPAIRMRRPTRG